MPEMSAEALLVRDTGTPRLWQVLRCPSSGHGEACGSGV